jgi:tRNA-2-methylthio-N6-dimethylallyladenosine synthase
MEKNAVYIETYGCQMNKLDSENVAAILCESGFAVVDDITSADIILLNTCGVRENAETRIHGRVGELSSLRRERSHLAIGIIGCMAQRLGEKLLSPVVKIVAGPDAYRRLPDMLRGLNSQGIADTALDGSETYEDVAPVRSTPFSAWIAAMRGCNNFCSYCIVPYTRGRERSIPVDRIIRELEDLREKGYREVTLLGQNVNSYRDGDIDFAALLNRAADTGLEWIRFLTSHPRDLHTRILETMAARENICNHLHLPLQSGSDAVLRRMARPYTVSRYLGLVETARSMIPGISITTDLMFGFPGETEEDYRRTLSVMERVRFDFAFLYRYSEREGTRACDLPGSVPESERIERLKGAIERQNAITAEKNRGQAGKIHTVLTKGQRGWYGFTETGVPVVFTTDDPAVKPGSFVKVRIDSSTGASLVGRGIH